MKAIQISEFGSNEVLSYTELAEPELNPGQVLIKNQAAGVNPIDWKTCSGGGAAPFIGDLPFIPGWEFAGTVAKIADDVTTFSVGDPVFGFIRFPERAGCFAEYVAAPVDQISLRPAELPVEAAAGLGLAGLTAWQALFDKGNLKASQRVVILAGAGGVGHLAIQLAKWAGAQVITTASAANHDFLTALGADVVIDYHTQKITDHAKDVDLVIDGIGGQVGIEALACVKPGGTLVTLPSATKNEVIAAGDAIKVNVEPIRVEPNSDQLGQLAGLYAEKKLCLNLANTYPLAQVGNAFDESKTGKVKGKLVLTI
ncbi:NADP-dependent oxidoreductase [Neptuniibacter pectenicola]|jgi:NADPH2:quinone reductase|uniref:NADP-dependent oxidoreductase n=1 Tax=Neptuniibacter pectenicola TaxID=1806669 RepID=UPI0030ED031A|tara:strand:- start:6399 stop:7337 length:939 start_codon:yes stop_codon:yes gene_type:complete